MKARSRHEKQSDGPWLSIGALGKATGIAVETLRTWENRYGFPVPQRKPSGHRVYPIDAVPRLRRIAQALSRGHRAGQVVGASDRALDQLLESTEAGRPVTSASLPPAEDLSGLLRLVEAFDADRLTLTLLGDWGRMTPAEFLEERIAPLVRAVGDGWESGELEVRHEHFLAERVGDLLRSLRLPYEEKATGPLVVLATLPAEAHGLGLLMAALLLASVGCRILYLGTQMPPTQVASLATDLGAAAVGLSVSLETRGGSTPATLRRLRERLPSKVALVVGGEGAPRPQTGIEVVQTLRELESWGRNLVSGRSPGSARRRAATSRRT
ncbi:MAG: MerR family transcriptional regulator [Acidobacteria bacterium]|jgi:DNA-binding transcriptional MerR regulator/methylmalonyl-CoA mutase cobalamin-binding subunit|nr:MerR family transcriptional regulator [Acidobacteriota bacterium]